MEDFTGPRPREMPGFEDAQASGRTPARPAEPPTPAGMTARSAFGVLIAVGVTAVIAAIATVLLMPNPEGTLTVATILALLVVLTLGTLAVWAALVTFRRTLLKELQQGYTTMTFEQGRFWVSSTGISGDVVGWDWRGTWVLNGDGHVTAPAQRDADPPGLYPSPHEPDRRELWTGHRWTKFYAD